MSLQSVGRFTYGHDGITIYDWGHGPVATIGNFCSIAGGCRFYLGGNHPISWVSTYPFGNIYKETFSNGKAGIGKLGDIVILNSIEF
jgi:acetyltransferase-like isoleucine patch superfamily enzyme